MKPQGTAGLLLLLLLASSSAGPVSLEIFRSCCSRFSSFRVPVKQILSVSETSRDCKPAAIIVETQRGKVLCLQPDSNWAKKLLKDFPRSSSP